MTQKKVKFNRVTVSKTNEAGYVTIRCEGEERASKVWKRRDRMIKTGYWVVTAYSDIGEVYTCTLQRAETHRANLKPEDFVDQKA